MSSKQYGKPESGERLLALIKAAKTGAPLRTAIVPEPVVTPGGLVRFTAKRKSLGYVVDSGHDGQAQMRSRRGPRRIPNPESSSAEEVAAICGMEVEDVCPAVAPSFRRRAGAR